MSTHGDIKRFGSITGLAYPEYEEGGICIEINMPEFLWADDVEEALDFLNKVIKHAQAGKRKLRKLGKKRV